VVRLKTSITELAVIILYSKILKSAKLNFYSAGEYEAITLWAKFLAVSLEILPYFSFTEVPFPA